MIDWGSMHVWELSSDLNSLRNIFWLVRSHRNHHVALEDTALLAREISLVHRNIGAFFNVSYTQSTFYECFFKRKGASNQKRDEIILPELCDVVSRLFELSISINLISWQVAPQIAPTGAELRAFHLARPLGHLQQGAGFRILLAELPEIFGILSRHNDEIRLHIAIALS
jgi:hypothetical protein